MTLFASIFQNNQSVTTDTEGTTYVSADVYISITDENGHPANGNNMVVTVAYNNNGDITNTDYTVAGQSRKIYSGVITRKLSTQSTPFDTRSFPIINTSDPGSQSPDPTVCDATITAVSIDKK